MLCTNVELADVNKRVPPFKTLSGEILCLIVVSILILTYAF